jgi:hypothetical protein
MRGVGVGFKPAPTTETPTIKKEAVLKEGQPLFTLGKNRHPIKRKKMIKSGMCFLENWKQGSKVYKRIKKPPPTLSDGLGEAKQKNI